MSGIKVLKSHIPTNNLLMDSKNFEILSLLDKACEDDGLSVNEIAIKLEVTPRAIRDRMKALSSLQIVICESTTGAKTDPSRRYFLNNNHGYVLKNKKTS